MTRSRRLLTISKSRRTESVSYLFLTSFPVDAPAPLGSGSFTYQAEIGEARLTSQPGQSDWRIVNSVLENVGASSSGSLASATPGDLSGFVRAPGMAFKHRTASNPVGAGPNEDISPSLGWSTGPGGTSASLISGLAFWTNNPHFAIIDRDSAAWWGLDRNTTGRYYNITNVLRSAGSFIVIGNKLAGVLARGNESPTYPVVGQLSLNRHVPRIDHMAVAQLGAPWNTDFGIATSRLAGPRSVGDTFTHDAGAQWIEFGVTTLPSSGHITVDFRRTDANNCWRLRIASSGTCDLLEVIAGVQTARATTTISNGDRLMCVLDGSEARVIRSRLGGHAQTTIYSAVNTFTSQTGGVVSSLGVGGAISDLVTWPRNLSGPAQAAIQSLDANIAITSPTLLESTIGEGPAALYPLSETSGTVAQDVIFGRAGTYVDGPVLRGATLAGLPVPVFDGVNDRVQLPSASLNQVFNPAEGAIVLSVLMTQGAWDSTTVTNFIVVGADTSNRFAIAHGFASGRVVFSSVIGGVAASNSSVHITTPNHGGKYVFLGLSWSASAGQVYRYIGGQAADAVSLPAGTWSGSLTDLWCQLASSNNLGRMPGNIGMVAIFNKALTVADLARMYSVFKAAEPNSV
jgi:hypothetical protein